MKALVYQGPNQRAWKDVPDPMIEQPTDIVVRVTSSTICGTDLHILKGEPRGARSLGQKGGARHRTLTRHRDRLRCLAGTVAYSTRPLGAGTQTTAPRSDTRRLRPDRGFPKPRGVEQSREPGLRLWAWPPGCLWGDSLAWGRNP